MDNILKKVSYPDYDLFRKRAMELFCWNEEKFKNKKIGRVKLTPAERIVLNQIADELKATPVQA